MPPDLPAFTEALSRPAEGGSTLPSRPWPSLVIFDCDGVLIDSEIVVCRLTAEEFTRLGYRVSTEDVIARFAGRPEREMIADVEADWGRRVPEEFFVSIKAKVQQAYATELRIMPGIVDVLDRLGTAACVASSAYPEKLRLGLETVGLYGRFAPDVVSASVVAQGKPAPDVFIYAAGWMRTQIPECLVIEDSVAGVRAARAAGMRVFGFTGGRHCAGGHRERLLAVGAEQVMESFGELQGLVPAVFRG
jgi:HAD superfamily hydrolase (TIGR01509 family)